MMDLKSIKKTEIEQFSPICVCIPCVCALVLCLQTAEHVHQIVKKIGSKLPQKNALTFQFQRRKNALNALIVKALFLSRNFTQEQQQGI
jgi:hypothetical protein